MSRVSGRLATELKQTRPFRSRRQEGTLGLLRTADVVRRKISEVVEPHGLTLQQYNVLRILRGAGPDGLPTLEIASRMIEASPGITRLLDRLEEKRLVARVRCPKDRRRVLCTATPEALRLLASLDAPVHAADDGALRMLTDRQTEALIALLDAIRSGPS
ncbi:MAG TPA: MarR family transcriptional regulator [Thermoanaerobaculia bacterium]|nr:MarR family transcriptional regulator [Thermoanaerobaculia bacterium]HQR67540.1 MarR family transcriptional regulator [Thermoanaerobaculia bacterium]